MLQRKLSARVVADFSVAGGVSTEDEMPKFRAVHDYSLAAVLARRRGAGVLASGKSGKSLRGTSLGLDQLGIIP